MALLQSRQVSSSKPGSSRRWYRRFNVPFWAALAATLVCILVYLGHRTSTWTLPAVDGLERHTSDTRFELRGTQERKDDRVIIVALDDRTLDEAPDLWQNRRAFADLINKVTDAEPRAIGIDVFFPTPEINLRQETKDAVEYATDALHAEAKSSESGLSGAAQTALEALDLVYLETQGDAVLAKAIGRSKNLVLAALFYLDGDPLPLLSKEPLGYSKGRFDESVHLEQPEGKRPPSASGSARPVAAIAGSIRHMGHVNVKHDEDGAVREVPLVIERAGRYYQSLSLKLASMALGERTSYAAGDDFVTLGTKRIPLNHQGFAQVGYLGGNGTFSRISAVEIMQSTTPHEALKDRIVLIGYTDTVRDKIHTPFARQFDGVALHATLIHNIIHDEIVQRGTPTQTVFALFAMGLALALLQTRRIRKRGAWLLGIGSVVCLGSYAVFAQFVFNRYNVQLEMIIPGLGFGVILLTALISSLATEGREKAQLRSAFGQYLQPSLIDKLLQDPEGLRLGGQRRELTVLFSDIRSFSRFSEALQPDELSDFLNQYLTPMTDIVMENSGMLDKYIGDAVMAVYGAPVPLDDHAERACLSALLMMAELVPLNSLWKENDLPEIKIGIGINTGEMSVGNMGSEAHFDYTVMGDAVNLGARLESLTKAYRLSILTGEATKNAASPAFIFREIDSVKVVGRNATATVYELCGTKEESPFSDSNLSLYQEALDAYRSADWDGALTGFRAFLKDHPKDGPTETMIERIRVLREQNLGDDWDGVFEQLAK